MIVLPLVVLPFVAGLFHWIADTVVPDVWATGRECGISPTREEHVYRYAVKALGHVVAVLWWLLVLGLVAQALSG